MTSVTLRVTLTGVPPGALTGAVHTMWTLRNDITCWLGLNPESHWVFVTSVTGRNNNGAAASPVPYTWRAPANAALPAATPEGCSQPTLVLAATTRLLLRRRALAVSANSSASVTIVVAMNNATSTPTTEFFAEVKSRVESASTMQSIVANSLLPRLHAVATDTLPGVDLAASAATVELVAHNAPAPTPSLGGGAT